MPSRVVTISYFSQDVKTCGSDNVDYACGVVSLANSLLLRGVSRSPKEILKELPPPSLAERGGLRPEEICALVACCDDGTEATVASPCLVHQLRPGDLMYVSSVVLKNIQGGCEYEESPVDAHIVMVERSTPKGITVINPDCRKYGRGFKHYTCGRMCIATGNLRQVWKTRGTSGLETTRAAVLLRNKSTSPA